MFRFLVFGFVLVLLGCKSGPTHNMTENEIDAYISDCLDTSQIYEIAAGLRFSKDDASYQVTEYSLYDTVVLYNTIEENTTSQRLLNIFYKDDLPIYIEEFKYEFPKEYTKVTERKIYLTGSGILKAYEKSSEFEFEIDDQAFEEVSLSYSDYDFERPRDAISQQGDYEMRYGEFLIINPESYLILENEESGYGVALYILEGDELLDELFAKPIDYRGKAIFVHHEFRMMSGIERMIYRGGVVAE